MKHIINVTPHEVRFTDGAETYTVPPSGKIVSATPVETPAGERSGALLVRTQFVAQQASVALLDEIERERPGALVVGSIIAAQAFPGRVLAMIAAPGYERVPVDQKVMRDDKFTVF